MTEVVIGITGASGAIYGIRLLEVLTDKSVFTHLVLSRTAREIIELETSYTPGEVEDLASAVYDEHDFTAPIASGSHLYNGMVIAPCSMKTLSAVATGHSNSLITRAADVCLKENRRLVLVPRETPLNIIHLQNMTRVAGAGAIVLPPAPGFYHGPQGIEDLVDFVVGRILDQLHIEHDLFERWKE